MMIPGENGLEAVLIKKLATCTLSVSLNCRAGETLVLTGPSGSGKTTVLRCLAGLEKIDGGTVHFLGKCWNNADTGLQVSPQTRGVGFLSQDYTLFPHMNLAKNIRFATADGDDPAELLEAMGIGHLQGKRPHQISGGERQRAALCQTLARRPGLLLLDEPFSALDIENRHLLRAKLAEVQRQWRLPIIQVTHDLVEALTVSTHTVCLRQGGEDPDWLQRQIELLQQDMEGVYRQTTPAAVTC